MGKNVRQRQEVKLKKAEQEKLEILQRRRERTQESIRLTRRLVLATASTIALLYVGVMVTSRLEEIISRISHTIQ